MAINAHDATYPFRSYANFGWGSLRSDGMRGFYIQGSDNIKLEGVASPNLGAFHVEAAYNWPAVGGTMNVAAAGEVGGPLAQNITYAREFSGSGYSDHFNGWLRRNQAPSGH